MCCFQENKDRNRHPAGEAAAPLRADVLLPGEQGSKHDVGHGLSSRASCRCAASRRTRIETSVGARCRGAAPPADVLLPGEQGSKQIRQGSEDFRAHEADVLLPGEQGSKHYQLLEFLARRTGRCAASRRTRIETSPASGRPASRFRADVLLPGEQGSKHGQQAPAHGRDHADVLLPGEQGSKHVSNLGTYWHSCCRCAASRRTRIETVDW